MTHQHNVVRVLVVEQGGGRKHHPPWPPPLTRTMVAVI